MKDFNKRAKLWTAINDLHRTIKRYPPSYATQSYNNVLVLNAISTHPNISLKELAEILNLRQSSLTQKLKPLEQKSLITRSSSPSDKRSFCLNLSKLGLDELESITNKSNSKLKEDKILSDKERKIFIELCSKLTKGLNDLNDK